MKRFLLLCGALLCLASIAHAEYSNASLNGPWLMIISGVETYDYAAYLIFDGQGNITELGAFNTPNPAGSYAVGADGAITGTIWADEYIPITGQMQTDTTATFYMGTVEIPVLKVMNPGACRGNWEAQFVLDGTGATYDVCITVDSDGTIESCTGFVAPVAGRFFTQGGWVAGHFTTGETEPGWNECMLQEAHLVGDTMLGQFGLDCGSCGLGSFELTHVPSCISGAENAPVLTLEQNYPNPFNPHTIISFSLNEPTWVHLSIHDATGRLVATLLDGEFSAGARRIEWDGRNGANAMVASGVYFCRLQAGEHTLVRKMILLR